MTWRDISTAPRDGTEILVWAWSVPPMPPWQGVDIAGWDVAQKTWDSSTGCELNPSHWMPLPDPPSSTTESERLEVLEGK